MYRLAGLDDLFKFQFPSSHGKKFAVKMKLLYGYDDLDRKPHEWCLDNKDQSYRLAYFCRISSHNRGIDTYRVYGHILALDLGVDDGIKLGHLRVYQTSEDLFVSEEAISTNFLLEVGLKSFRENTLALVSDTLGSIITKSVLVGTFDGLKFYVSKKSLQDKHGVSRIYLTFVKNELVLDIIRVNIDSDFDSSSFRVTDFKVIDNSYNFKYEFDHKGITYKSDISFTKDYSTDLLKRSF